MSESNTKPYEAAADGRVAEALFDLQRLLGTLVRERDEAQRSREYWYEEARRYAGNADHHQGKRRAAEAQVETLRTAAQALRDAQNEWAELEAALEAAYDNGEMTGHEAVIANALAWAEERILEAYGDLGDALAAVNEGSDDDTPPAA